MTTMRHTKFLCVLLGAMCIQSITARPQSDPYGWNDAGSLLSDDIYAGFGVNPPTDFNDNLYVQLLQNNAFRRIFNGPYRADVVNNLISCAADSIAQEFQVDPNLAMIAYYSSMANIYPGSTAEVYASTAADSLAEVLGNYNTLSAYNSLNIANTVADIFNRCAVEPDDVTDNLDNDYGGTDNLDNPNLDTDLNPIDGLGTGLDAGLGEKALSGLLPGLGAGLGAGAGIGVGLVDAVGVGTGLCLNGDLDPDALIDGTLDLGTAVVLFQQNLKKELLKDRYFRSVFTDSIPETAISNIASAVAQFLSKAFKLPRTYLLSLERDLISYIKRDLATPEEYAEGVASSFVDVLTTANLLEPSAICVQIGMASKAITSGILNFVGTNNVAGVGLGFSRNPYNSYFSILSGLEMLPYVGPDAVSRKYPPILKAIRATNFGARFTQALTSNLISSSRFSSSFLLGIPPPIWKNVARCIGNSMAEAFGSVNPAFFNDVYANALLSMGMKLSYKTYARVLSAATAKALYALGYFVSGNPNIQAAIAANAIIRTTGNRCILRYKARFPALKTNLGLPWMTPVAGVLPPQVDTDLDVGVNVDLDAGDLLDVDLTADAQGDLPTGGGLLSAFGRKRRDLTQPSLGNARQALGSAQSTLGNAQPALGNARSALGNAPSSLGNTRPALGNAQSTLANTQSTVTNAQTTVVNSKPTLGNIPDVRNVGVPVDALPSLPSDVDVPNVGLSLGSDLQPDLGVNVGLGDGLDVDINVGDPDGALTSSILDVLPQMLAEKLFASTAMYTAMSMVGPRKVANLIGQGIAAQFGFPSAAIFSNSYDISIANMPESNFSPSIVAIARATTEALANAGVLTNGFTILSADQLSTAIVAKYSSLIATSLDTKEWNVGPRWTYIYDQDFIAPPLSRGYNYWRPNVFSGYVGSFDDSLALDYGMGNSVTLNVPANNGIPSARSKILLK